MMRNNGNTTGSNSGSSNRSSSENRNNIAATAIATAAISTAAIAAMAATATITQWRQPKQQQSSNQGTAGHMVHVLLIPGLPQNPQ
jgi:hypothetical protein